MYLSYDCEVALAEIVKLYEEGKFKVPRRHPGKFSLRDLGKAHAIVEEKKAVGKVVITV